MADGENDGARKNLRSPAHLHKNYAGGVERGEDAAEAIVFASHLRRMVDRLSAPSASTG